MSTIPKFTRKAIQQWTNEQSFQRGHTYFQKGAIYDQCRSGMTLKSKCSGTQAPFYRQEVIFDDKGIQSAQCSCPVGSGGCCKHVVALLLTWVENQQSFHEIENLDKVLATKSQAELIAIIRRLVTAQPDLEDLVSLPVAGQQHKIVPPDLKAIRRQLTRAREELMNGYDKYWGERNSDLQDILNVLEPMLTLAEDYLSKSDPTSATAIYIVICDELAESDMMSADEEGSLADVLLDCTKGLGKCLTAINDTVQRQEILRILFTIYELDIVKMGGIDLSSGIPDIFVNQTSFNEKEEIVKWLREVIQKNQERKFVKENFGEMLLELKKDQLNDESYLAICHEMQLVDCLVERLLKLNRVEEAVQACQHINDYKLVNLADIFVRCEYASYAEELIQQRTKISEDVDMAQIER